MSNGQLKPGRELDVLVDRHVMKSDGLPRDAPRYSTYIGAAWEVLEKFEHVDVCKTTTKNGAILWEVDVWKSSKLDDYIIGETAPHAICLAALRAVGVDIDAESA